MKNNLDPVSMISEISSNVERILNPLKPATSHTKAPADFYMKARRCDVGDLLPAYYLIYFMLADLLHYTNSGRAEKVAWSIPIDYKGSAYLIEHRKFGVGLFTNNPEKKQCESREIAIRLKKAVKAAETYFASIAKEAVNESKVNLINKARPLFSRYEFFHNEYIKKKNEATGNKGKLIDRKISRPDGSTLTYKSDAYYSLMREANWLAFSAIESFFSWTEHVFLSISLLTDKISTASEVADMRNLNWKKMYAKTLGSIGGTENGMG